MITNTLVKIVWAFTLVWLVLGLFPALLFVTGDTFLPSVEWNSLVSFPSVAAGLIFAVSFSCAVLKGQSTISAGKLKKFTVGFFCPFFGYWIGKNVIVITLPMLIALIAGAEVQLPYKVAHANDSGVRHCRSPVKFQGLPFVYDRVCGVTEDLRRSLSRGETILVSGRGTHYGVFARSLRRVE